MFDLHALGKMQDGFEALAKDVETFKKYFGSYVPSAVCEAWHGELFPGGDASFVKFAVANTPDLSKFPTVIVGLEDEPLEDLPLRFGHTERVVDGNIEEKFSMHVKETVTISVMSVNSELVRALHTVCRGLMFGSLDWFINVGYDSMEYLGSADLDPYEVVPELWLYSRKMRWSALGIVETPVVISTKKTGINLYSNEIVVDGVAGGVKV